MSSKIAQFKNRRLFTLLLALGLGILTTGFSEPRRFEYFRMQMGTRTRVILYAAGETEAREAAAAAFDRIRQLDEMMSDYNPESELSRLCHEIALGPRVVSQDLFTVLERSLEYSKISRGAFDVTVGPLVALWREARRERRLPDPERLEQARKFVGSSKITLDPETRTVRLAASGMKLDLGGIAKGYAADQALSVLRARGIRSALVALGGDIALSDAPPDQTGWHIAIQGTSSLQDFEGKLLLQHCGVSTSGDTEQFVEFEGVRYSHIVDPRTGWSLRDSAKVTVIAPNATASDALATALSVLPPEDALKLVEAQEGVAAHIVPHSGSQRYTSRRMKKQLRRAGSW